MDRSHPSPLILALIAGIGMFLSTLDAGVINIAIPSLTKIFHCRVETVIRTVTVYTFVLSATILLFGRLADKHGHLKIYQLGLMMFAVSSFFSGVSMNITFLIVCRGLQGLGAAMIQATAIALLTTRLDKEGKTQAMGTMGVLIALGPLMGPVLGGFILAGIGWRWIFWMNIPICLLGLYGCMKLKQNIDVQQPQPIFYSNLILLGAALFSLLFGLSMLSHNKAYSLVLWLATILIVVAYVLKEMTCEYPIIPFSLFKKISFTAPMLGLFAFGGATAIAFMLPPLYFEKLRGLQVWQVGLLSLAAPIGIITTSKLSVLIGKKFSMMTPMLLGMSVVILSLFLLTQMQIPWPLTLIVLALFAYGIGGGLYQPPCYLMMTAQFPNHQQGFVLSLTRMLINLAVAFESAGAGVLISIKDETTPTGLLAGIQGSWFMAMVIALIAMIFLVIFFYKTKNQVS